MKLNDDTQQVGLQATDNTTATGTTNVAATGGTGKKSIAWATDGANTGTGTPMANAGKTEQAPPIVWNTMDKQQPQRVATTNTTTETYDGPQWVKPENAYQAAYLASNPLPSKEQQEREAKRSRRQALWSSIGDGISALSNLYFTTKGAPNAYDPKNSLTAAYNKRQKQLEAVREANRQAWLKGYEKAQENDRKHNLDRQKLSNDAWYKAAAARNQRERNANTKAYQDTQVEEARKRQAGVDALNKEKIETEKYKRRNLQAQANKANRWVPSSGRRGGSGGNSKEGRYRFDVGNNFHGRYQSAAEREGAIAYLARVNGISTEEEDLIGRKKKVPTRELEAQLKKLGDTMRTH